MVPGRLRDQSVLPFAASRHSRYRSVPVSLADCVKSLPRETTGEELPLPGSATFQRMPSPSLNCTGMLVSAEMPAPLGPRKRGQSSAWTAVSVTSRPRAIGASVRQVGARRMVSVHVVEEGGVNYPRFGRRGKRRACGYPVLDGSVARPLSFKHLPHTWRAV